MIENELRERRSVNADVADVRRVSHPPRPSVTRRDRDRVQEWRTRSPLRCLARARRGATERSADAAGSPVPASVAACAARAAHTRCSSDPGSSRYAAGPRAHCARGTAVRSSAAYHPRHQRRQPREVTACRAARRRPGR